MPSINNISWKLFEKFVVHIGCVFVRQKGSHRMFFKSGLKQPIVIPCHSNKPLMPGVIRNNLKTLGMTPKEFLEIVRYL
ncbi:MAG: hypothetical protein A2V81_01460 [Candidatus Abawacabacteria bacterium RBG_16_42_10]|uniref:Addiction module toxin, HicA family n=1 Tax=Candidatus Abawacabacteria bacterium RBG_16_42_10 TaxID=1817814 RepID=A0A1F4XLW5_9BACT|nr:MAG: hypothetical protein A2V81_01460 [Candidatus Abawacabacteria bacterium RBG_16_42_10]